MIHLETLRSDEPDDDDEIFGTIDLTSEDEVPLRTFLPFGDIGCSLGSYDYFN
jgi:hypothetical protein